MASVPACAASRVHVITFGKWQTVKTDSAAGIPRVELRVRALLVDGKLRVFTTGQPHDVTETVFVVASALRLNDRLPDEKQEKWVWQRGGWLQVDRSSGSITPVKMPNFDPQLSVASCYRDYVAFCGVSDDRVYAIVMQLGSRKPILRKELDAAPKTARAAPLCPAPVWQRQPIRVDFKSANGPHLTFAVQERTFEITTPEEDDPD